MKQHLSWSPTPSKVIHAEQTNSIPFYPLHRSLTDEQTYNDKPSAITRFVSKLLGLPHPQRRPHLPHKSHSTTSITKGDALISSAHDTPVTVSDWSDISSDSSASISSSSCGHRRSRSCGCSPSSPSSPISPLSPAVHALVAASKKKQRLVTFLDAMDPLQLVNRHSDTKSVLTTALGDKIRPYLPRRHRLAPCWTLLYSLDQHGSSLRTLYHQVKSSKGPVILIIKDADEQIFGAFLNEAPKSKTSYYGTGECFLWKAVGSRGTIKVFPWTGKNDYMILSENDFIAIGGGDGRFGLWINSDLENGHSEPCPTFDNDVLSLEPKFSCVALEIWGFLF